MCNLESLEWCKNLHRALSQKEEFSLFGQKSPASQKEKQGCDLKQLSPVRWFGGARGWLDECNRDLAGAASFCHGDGVS